MIFLQALPLLILAFPTEGRRVGKAHRKVEELGFTSFEIPEPSIPLDLLIPGNASDAIPLPQSAGLASCQGTPQFIDTCIDSDMDLLQSPSLPIPPDPHGAAGPNSIIAVVNREIEILRKDGNVVTSPIPLQTMFGAALGFTRLFDPKILYDVHQDRFVVVVLDSNFDTVSRILVAVSKTDDPETTTAADWWFLAINSLIAGTWADYPGIAVDKEALYITNNMFSVSSGTFVTSRIWIIDKLSFYDGETAVFNQYDYVDEAGGGTKLTHMPAMVRAPNGIPNNVGTYLVGYSGLSDSDQQFIQIVQIRNPLSVPPTFTLVEVPIGNIDQTPLDGIPDAPQPDRSELISTNDNRALDAVWVDNALWMVTTVEDFSGESSAYWLKFNADGINAPTLADQGYINGEDLGPGTFTYFPSIDVNSKGVAAFGFAASSLTIYAGAYATIRDDTVDPPGAVRTPADVVKAGTHPYFIDFSGGLNRWGDYTGMALDPVDDDCFWAFNEYASAPCFTLGTQSGCWKTAWARLCFATPPSETTSTSTTTPPEETTSTSTSTTTPPEETTTSTSTSTPLEETTSTSTSTTTPLEETTSTSTTTPPEETTTSTSTTTPLEETTSTTSTPPGIVGTSFSCFNVGDLDPFNVTGELGNTGADGLKDILEYHNTFVADACETILNMIDDVDCVSNYEELMCSLEAGYDDIDVCANSVIEFPLYIGTGSDVRSTAYAAPVLTLPKKFKMNCPSCNCGFARKFAFPILDQLAPFCPFFGVGIDSKYTIEGFTYFTSIPEGPDDVIIDEVDPANNVFELLYNKTLETPSQFNVFNMNSFTSDSAEDRDMLGNLTTIKTKAESKATTKCGSRGRRRAIAKFDFDEGFYDSVVDGNARRLVGVVDTTKMSKSNRKQLRTGRLQEVEAVEEGDLLFCNDTFYEANYTTYIYPPEYAATVVGPDVTESTAAQYIIKAWDANGDGFVNCTESMMKCNEFLAKYGATEVTVDTFFSLFTP